MANPVNWFEIYVSDMERAKAFYQSVCAIELMNLPSPDEGEMWVFPMEEGAAGSAGALVKHPQGNPGMGGTMVYISCEDCATEAGRIAENGGTLTQEKTSIGEFGYIAMFEDTEGNAVGLHSHN